MSFNISPSTRPIFASPCFSICHSHTLPQRTAVVVCCIDSLYRIPKTRAASSTPKRKFIPRQMCVTRWPKILVEFAAEQCYIRTTLHSSSCPESYRWALFDNSLTVQRTLTAATADHAQRAWAEMNSASFARRTTHRHRTRRRFSQSPRKIRRIVHGDMGPLFGAQYWRHEKYCR